MATLTKDQKIALWRSSLALAGVVVVSVVALLLNKPPEKVVTFDAVCRSFVAPVPLQLKLHAGEGEVQRAMADGFDTTIENMSSATFSIPGSSPGGVKGSGFKLNRVVNPHEMPSRLDLAPSGGFGIATLDVGSGAVISSFAEEDARPWVNAELPKEDSKGAKTKIGSTLQLVLVSPVNVLKANRYIVDGIAMPKLPKTLIDEFQTDIRGEIPGARADLKSGDPGAKVKVWFGPVTKQVNLFEGTPEAAAAQSTAAQGGEVANEPLLLEGCVNPDLRIEKKSATGVIADRPTEMKIQAIAGTIELIAIAAGVEKTEKLDAPRLRVKGRAHASSMQQDEHELLPTWVGEVMDMPYAERGWRLIVVGFVLFLAFKVLDRTLGVLMEFLFPKV